jgi:hypothetical protein
MSKSENVWFKDNGESVATAVEPRTTLTGYVQIIEAVLDARATYKHDRERTR